MGETYAYRTVRRYGVGAPGRTTVGVTCECGQRAEKFSWSWAGHGYYWCRGCGKPVPWLENRQGLPAGAPNKKETPQETDEPDRV